MTTKPDWMIEKPLPPLKDTRTKRQKARDAVEIRKHQTVYIPLRFPDGTTGGMCVRRSDLE